MSTIKDAKLKLLPFKLLKGQLTVLEVHLSFENLQFSI